MLIAAIAVAVGVAAQDPAQPLPGCHATTELLQRVSFLQATDWDSWTRASLGKTWPGRLEFLERDFATHEVIWFQRSGRLIEGRLECGESYRFFPPISGAGDTLREFRLSHAEPSRSQVISVAWQLIRLIAPPTDAGRAQTICIDCGDPGDELVSRQWTTARVTSVVQAFVHPGVHSYVVDLTWSRKRE